MAREKLAGQNIHDSALGRVDLLFGLLRELEINTPEHLAKYISALHADLERRTLAEQVIDQVLAEDTGRYSTFEHIRMLDVPSPSFTTSDLSRVTQSEAIGQFMALWIDYEKMIRSYTASKGATALGVPSMRMLRMVEGVPADVHEAAERLRRFRNQLVHGIEVPDAEFIHAQAADLRNLVERVRQIIGPKPKPTRKTIRKVTP
jgi:hypothetical protein